MPRAYGGGWENLDYAPPDFGKVVDYLQTDVDTLGTSQSPFSMAQDDLACTGSTTAEQQSNYKQEISQSMAQGIAAASGSFELQDGSTERLAVTKRGIRFCTKSKGCSTCDGPCGVFCGSMGKLWSAPTDCDADGGEPIRQRQNEPTRTSSVDEEPADTFMRIALARKRQRELSMDEDTKRVKESPSPVESQSKKGKKRMRPVALPTAYGKLPSWLIKDPRVGGIPINSTHQQHLGWHRGLLWCWACGRYATRTPMQLKDDCKKPTEAGHNTLVRLRQGKHPYMTPWPLAE